MGSLESEHCLIELPHATGEHTRAGQLVMLYLPLGAECQRRARGTQKAQGLSGKDDQRRSNREQGKFARPGRRYPRDSFYVYRDPPCTRDGLRSQR